MQKIIIQELKSPGCQICARFEDFWKNKIAGQFPNAELKTIDVTTPEGQELAQKYMIFASPGLIINGELFSTGGYDEDKFIDKLKKLSE
ncbi:MAG: thioredoxin family protein [Candidatus Brennerbacteria bacterium]|nr:thioredoxin family protein [Candidatus Brennerbacteria bacterium]